MLENQPRPFGRDVELLCFLMHLVLMAKLAVLFHFKPGAELFLIFTGKIIGALALTALQFDHCFLRHTNILMGAL